MLGLYLYTLIIGHKSCNMLSNIVKGIANFCDKQCGFFDKKSKNTTTTKQKMKHKNPCRIWGLNPGPLANKADALPLHHRVN